MNTKLEMIAEEAAENLRKLIQESEIEILSSWDKVVEEGQLNETSPKLSIGFSIILDLDKDKVTHRLAWSHKTVREVETDIPDPDQLRLPIGKETDDEED